MDAEPTDQELAVVNDASALADALWTKSLQVSGLSFDPKMLSIMLFKRLWSNHRGYVVLWQNGLNLESDIVLRSGLEAAISIAANFKLKHAFVMMMRQDAAWTLQRQIKLHRDNGERELVRDGEAALRDLQSTIPAGLKPAKLEWKLLAEQGGVAQLYDFHRLLSGVSSHVTGLSILRGVSGANLSGTDFGAGGTTRKMHLMILAGSTLTASMLHAGMIDDEESVSAALAITNRLNDLSLEWPRTGP